jgi:hypothetical protein
MSYSESFNRIVSSYFGSENTQSQVNKQFARDASKLNNLHQGLENSREARKSSLPDRYEARTNGVALGKVYAHHKGIHDVNKQESAVVLRDHLLKENPRTLPGLSIHDSTEAKSVSLGKAVSLGNRDFARLFQAADIQRNLAD